MTLTSSIQASAPLPVDLHDMLISNPDRTVFAYSGGSSMTGAFIPPNALLVIDREAIPGNSDIVIAEVEGKFILRYLKINPYNSWLCNAGTRYREMKLVPGSPVRIWGVVTHVISRPVRTSATA